MSQVQGEMDTPYDTQTSQAWLDAVGAWDWIPEGKQTWRLSGVCPRCQHEMSKVVQPTQIFTFTFSVGSRDDATSDPPATVTVACNCEMDHSGRPDGEAEAGCGYAGVFAGPGA